MRDAGVRVPSCCPSRAELDREPWGEESPRSPLWIVLISSFLTSLQLAILIRCVWANIDGAERLGGMSVYFTCIFTSGLTVSPGPWLTISVELNDARECNSKSLHNCPDSCAPLACCLRLVLTQPSVGAFEITVATRALAGPENLELLGFQDRKIKSLIAVF